MPITGLVVRLSPDRTLRAQVYDFLRQRPEVTLGEPQTAGLPIVVDIETTQATEELVSQLEGLAGVQIVELVYADFSDVQDIPRQRRRRDRVEGGG